jgi:AcrR family transcriptional regulator
VLGENGYEGFRVEEVARRVGVAKGTVYLDFDSKQKLIDSSLAAAGAQLVLELSEEINGIADPGDRLLEVARQVAVRLLESPWLGILVECRPVPSGTERMLEPCAPLRVFLEGIVEDARKAGALRDEVEETTTAEAILGLLSRPACRTLVAEKGFTEALRRSGLQVSPAAAPS